MHRILLVDDELNILNALKRELHGGYAIEAFTDPHLALQFCQTNHFDLVVVDYKMAEMNGIEFLRQFGKVQPDAMRIMLSGEADFNALISAINEMHIYRFISKPWDATELATTIAEALIHRLALLENRRLFETCKDHRILLPSQNPDWVYQVLVVDDEPNVLSAIARDIKARGGFYDMQFAIRHQIDPSLSSDNRDLHFNIFTTTSPVQALERAKQFRYDVVISDYLMPEMDGLHFLSELHGILPDATRILISGKADKEVLIKAINRSEIYGYICKPWHEYTLRSILAQAVDYHDLLIENRLRAKHAGG